LKVTRAITIDVSIFDLINGIVDYAANAKKEELAPYFWQKLREAADTMEREYNGEYDAGKTIGSGK